MEYCIVHSKWGGQFQTLIALIYRWLWFDTPFLLLEVTMAFVWYSFLIVRGDSLSTKNLTIQVLYFSVMMLNIFLYCAPLPGIASAAGEEVAAFLKHVAFCMGEGVNFWLRMKLFSILFNVFFTMQVMLWRICRWFFSMLCRKFTSIILLPPLWPFSGEESSLYYGF